MLPRDATFEVNTTAITVLIRIYDMIYSVP